MNAGVDGTGAARDENARVVHGRALAQPLLEALKRETRPGCLVSLASEDEEQILAGVGRRAVTRCCGSPQDGCKRMHRFKASPFGRRSLGATGRRPEAAQTANSSDPSDCSRGHLRVIRSGERAGDLQVASVQVGGLDQASTGPRSNLPLPDGWETWRRVSLALP